VERDLLVSFIQSLCERSYYANSTISSRLRAFAVRIFPKRKVLISRRSYYVLHIIHYLQDFCETDSLISHSVIPTNDCLQKETDQIVLINRSRQAEHSGVRTEMLGSLAGLSRKTTSCIVLTRTPSLTRHHLYRFFPSCSCTLGFSCS
jgi:hypothetical protein